MPLTKKPPRKNPEKKKNSQNANFDPLYKYLLFLMTFKAWSKYAAVKKPSVKAQEGVPRQKTKVLFIRELFSPKAKTQIKNQEKSKINLIKKTW